MRGDPAADPIPRALDRDDLSTEGRAEQEGPDSIAGLAGDSRKYANSAKLAKKVLITNEQILYDGLLPNVETSAPDGKLELAPSISDSWPLPLSERVIWPCCLTPRIIFEAGSQSVFG
jgi:hypothetical protein